MIEKLKTKLTLNEIVLSGAFLFIFLIGIFSNENFLSIRNILSLFQQMSEMGIMAMGLTLVIITGGMDLSSGTTMGLCAVVSGLCLTHGIGLALTFAISLSVAVLCGILNGVLIAVVKIPPMIATLGTQMFFNGIALALSQGNSISGIPEKFYFLGQAKVAGVPLQMILLFAFAAILFIILKKKVIGQQIYSIGNNSKASLYSGIRTTRVILFVYIVCSVLCCFAGNIQVSRVATARADMGTSFLMICISAVVLGGTSIDGGNGGITGTVVGILIFAMIGNIMNLVGISPFWQQLATGSILVLVVVFNKTIEMQKYKIKSRKV
ncbi:MAG: ABC transporter permease [Lachnospiraceae bacterium]|nr:ABC transporter permease [Lachnospiraceae bacterium]